MRRFGSHVSLPSSLTNAQVDHDSNNNDDDHEHGGIWNFPREALCSLYPDEIAMDHFRVLSVPIFQSESKCEILGMIISSNFSMSKNWHS